ncbi:MAG: hypothetical protein Q9218_004288 [Villophora microphyllina]
MQSEAARGKIFEYARTLTQHEEDRPSLERFNKLLATQTAQLQLATVKSTIPFQVSVFKCRRSFEELLAGARQWSRQFEEAFLIYVVREIDSMNGGTGDRAKKYLKQLYEGDFGRLSTWRAQDGKSGEPDYILQDTLNWIQARRSKYWEDREKLTKLTMLLGQRAITLDILTATCAPQMRHSTIRCADAFKELCEKTPTWQEDLHEEFSYAMDWSV